MIRHRGGGALGSLVLGSVGLGLVLHAPCAATLVLEPVAVRHP